MPIEAAAGAGDQSADSSLNSPGGASPSTLAGGDASPDTGGSTPQGGDGGLKQALQAVRQILTQVMGLSRQFPAAASSLREAENGLRSAMRQIVSNPGSPEPPSPSIGG